MPTDPFSENTAALRALGGQRVWSLMISLFGDLAQGAGDRIDGPVLSAIMARQHIKPEAVRVALHRLRKDGWVTSEKSGRIRQHSLTDKGRRESAIASPRIYARPGSDTQDWQLILLPPSDADTSADMIARGFAAITTRTYIGPQSAQPPADALALPGDDVPGWLRNEAAPDDLREDYMQLLCTLTDLKAKLGQISDLSQIEVAVLRCLVVHNWRRLVLRHAPLPPALLPEDWPGHSCHQMVASLLDRFPRPDLSRIAQQPAAA